MYARHRLRGNLVDFTADSPEPPKPRQPAPAREAEGQRVLTALNGPNVKKASATGAAKRPQARPQAQNPAPRGAPQLLTLEVLRASKTRMLNYRKELDAFEQRNSASNSVRSSFQGFQQVRSMHVLLHRKTYPSYLQSCATELSRNPQQHLWSFLLEPIIPSLGSVCS